MIWWYVFSGETIHVDSPDAIYPEHARLRYCKYRASPAKEAKSITARPHIKPPYSVRHARCCSASSPSTVLNVLRVCRQLHHEAALLPFTGNVFTFMRFPAVKRFLGRLRPGQAHELRHISWVENANHTGHWCAAGGEELRASLPALSDLTIFLEFDDFSAKHFIKRGHAPGIRAFSLAMFLSGLAPGTLNNATIVPLLSEEGAGGKAEYPAEIWQWAEKMRQMMTGKESNPTQDGSSLMKRRADE